MSKYFGREYELIIDDGTKTGYSIKDLRIAFKITKSLTGFPNLAEIQIYNLSKESRNKIKNLTNIKLMAGYNGNIKQIFKGEVRNINNVYSKPDWVTEIFAGDASKSLETSTINKTLGKGANTESILNELIGNLDGVTKGATEGIKDCISKKQSILKSIILSGSVKEFLDKMAENCGFKYSVNDGLIETVSKNKIMSDEPVSEINQANGLLKIPEITEIGVNITTLLKPELKLGRGFKVTSLSSKLNIGNLQYRTVRKTISNNTFRMNTITHIGDTHTNDWKTEIKGQLINA